MAQQVEKVQQEHAAVTTGRHRFKKDQQLTVYGNVDARSITKPAQNKYKAEPEDTSMPSGVDPLTTPLFTVCAFDIATVHIAEPVSRKSDPKILNKDASKNVTLCLITPVTNATKAARVPMKSRSNPDLVKL